MAIKKITFSEDNLTIDYTDLSSLQYEFVKRNIVIGNDVYLGSVCEIGNNVQIGNKSIILSYLIPEGSKFGEQVKIFCDLWYPVDVADKTIILNDVKIENECVISEDVFIDSFSILHKGCVIGKGSKLHGCSLGEKTIVGQNVTISKKIKLKENSNIFDNTFLESIVFNGSRGLLIYWGTDEIHLDMGVNNFDENYQIYTIKEFADLLRQKALHKLMYDEKSGSKASWFSQNEIDEYQYFFDIILAMDKKEIFKPREKDYHKSNDYEFYKKEDEDDRQESSYEED